jgi:hypothetical protein
LIPHHHHHHSVASLYRTHLFVISRLLSGLHMADDETCLSPNGS